MILDRFLITDQVAVVTGAGRGIGAATALALAEAGADVVIAARSQDDLSNVASRIEATGRRAQVVVTDLSDLDNVAALSNIAVEAFGRLDVVVNNLGGAMPREWVRTSSRVLNDAFQFNVATAHALNRAAVPLMLDSGGGSVVAISSIMGRVSGRGYLAYGTAKGALAHYTRLAARDLAPKIRVNAIAVGSVATSALDIVMGSDELRGQMEAVTPLGRIGDPQDIAASVLYLCSPAGSYVTGKVLEVDGGLEQPSLDLGFADL